MVVRHVVQEVVESSTSRFAGSRKIERVTGPGLGL